MLVWSAIAYLLAAAVGVAALYLLARALVLDRAWGRRRCPRCWYDMSGTAGLRCSECGHDARSERRLLRTRRHPATAIAGILLFFLAGALSRVPMALEQRTWWALLPTPVVLVLLQASSPDDEVLWLRLQSANIPQLSTWERYAAARVCGRILAAPRPTPGEPTSAILAALRRIESAYSMLPQLGHEARAATPVLITLASAQAGDSRLAIEALGAMGTAGDAAVPTLIHVAQHGKTFDIRWAAADALGEMRQRPRSVIPALEQMAKEESRLPHTYAKALAKFGPAAVPAMIRLLEVDRPDLQVAMLRRLISKGPFNAAEEAILVSRAASLRPLELKMVLWGIGSARTDSATGDLLVAIWKATDAGNREMIDEWVIDSAAARSRAAGSGTASLGDPDPDLRIQAMLALGELPAGDLAEFLLLVERMAAEDPDWTVRLAAIRLLEDRPR